MKVVKILLFTLFLCQPLSSYAASLPKELIESLDLAYITGDSFVIKSVTEAALKKYPNLENDITTLSTTLAAKQSYFAASKSTNKEITSENKSEKKESPWGGNVELGLNYSSGNTEKEDINAASELTYKNNEWENTLKLKVYTSKEKGVRNNEEYRAKNQTRYNLSESDFTFLELEYVNDRFSGFDRRTTENIGYGRHFWKEDDFKLSGEASVGTRQSKKTDGDNENSLIQKLAGNLDWQIIDNLSFTEELSTSFGGDAIITESESALKTKVADDLYLKLAFTVEHISDVPQDRENTDTFTSLSLVYDY